MVEYTAGHQAEAQGVARSLSVTRVQPVESGAASLAGSASVVVIVGARQGCDRPIAGFLDIPERSAKPRERGLTHVIDRGLSVAEVDGLLEVAGDSVDVVKLGWGTALVSANLRPKLERYAAHGIPVVLGGTLTELAIRQGRVEGLIAWLHELGLRHVEVSDGTIALDPEVKRELIRRLAGEFTVLAEVGSKDAAFIMAPYVWVEQIEGDLEAGAWKVIAEARESGTAGIYRADGEVRTGLIDEIAHAVDTERLIFEAPLREQQVWLLQALRHGVQPRQHRARRRALAGDAAAGPALGHGRAVRAGRRRLTHRARDRLDRADRTGRTVVFALLVLACFAAFFVTQRLKHTPTAVQHFKLTPRFSPTPAGAHQTGADLLQARQGRRGDGDDHRLPRQPRRDARARSSRARATNSSPCAGTAAAAPAHRHVRRRGNRAAHDPRSPRLAGRLAPAGEYRVRVSLRRQDRTVLSPRSFTLVGG